MVLFSTERFLTTKLAGRLITLNLDRYQKGNTGDSTSLFHVTKHSSGITMNTENNITCTYYITEKKLLTIKRSLRGL